MMAECARVVFWAVIWVTIFAVTVKTLIGLGIW